MWTPTTRRQHSRRGLRYETDLTTKEWRLIEPYLPARSRYGRPRGRSLREIVNAIFYVLRGGIAWRLLPSDFPPWQTVYRWFAAWRDSGVFEKINHALVMADRERVGRDASPSAAIIDSQSVKTTEAGGPRGYDAGKKINGRKRHALVDTDGRGLVLEPHPAEIQDRDGGGPLLCVSRRPFPFIEKVFADSGYAGDRVARATIIAVEIVRKNPDQVGFAVNPRRWVVERFFAWIGRNRRLAKDFRRCGNSAALSTPQADKGFLRQQFREFAGRHFAAERCRLSRPQRREIGRALGFGGGLQRRQRAAGERKGRRLRRERADFAHHAVDEAAGGAAGRTGW